MTGTDRQQNLVTAGAPLRAADAAVVLLHSRGETARNVVQWADEFHHHSVAQLAPQAPDNSWYPNAFTAPIEANEPQLAANLAAVRAAVDTALDVGIPRGRVMLCGFSQGACLAAEFVARNPARYGGLAVLSGGLLGETVSTDEYEGTLDGMPVFLGCGTADQFVPVERVHKSAAMFDALNADVATRIVEGRGHGIDQDEADRVSAMVAGLVQ
ncbi:alpha/beta hydrolase [Haloarchaeobius sp. DFWS5]|uniref:alpha/beta hydrolase n=1 Tax=Haloarchaeobius sp. DFWS5 TaxID=3446114 RepID=UPI003EBB003F